MDADSCATNRRRHSPGVNVIHFSDTSEWTIHIHTADHVQTIACDCQGHIQTTIHGNK
jgi:hypothetical protein